MSCHVDTNLTKVISKTKYLKKLIKIPCVWNVEINKVPRKTGEYHEVKNQYSRINRNKYFIVYKNKLTRVTLS